MNEELSQLDADLKGLLVEEKLDEMIELLGTQPESSVKEISEYNWSIIKKYYDTENYELLLKHMKFVAYTCFIVEYAHQTGLVDEKEFGNRMTIFNDIYEVIRQ